MHAASWAANTGSSLRSHRWQRWEHQPVLSSSSWCGHAWCQALELQRHPSFSTGRLSVRYHRWIHHPAL